MEFVFKGKKKNQTKNTHSTPPEKAYKPLIIRRIFLYFFTIKSIFSFGMSPPSKQEARAPVPERGQIQVLLSGYSLRFSIWRLMLSIASST
ncbi:MAG: hypothetical protein IJF77_01910, partial [Alistipes sp.]|nr:hypothetical protein [Alistipes sp.]